MTYALELRAVVKAYLSFRALDGLDLQQFVTRFGPMPPERVTGILAQACHSLTEAHSVAGKPR